MEMNEFKPRLIIEDRENIRWLTISNPNRRNALTRDILADLATALKPQSIKDKSINVVVLTGDEEGNCFSSGFNILDIDEVEKAKGLDPISAPAQSIEKCPVPVIAAINGLVMGGAFEIAMACDFRIADSEARLGMPPAKIGLVYSGEGLLRFIRQIPLSVVKRMFLLGETLTAEFAKENGIVDEIVPSEDLNARTMKWAEMVANNAPMAVEGMLEILRMFVQRVPVNEQEQALIADWREKTIASADLKEGLLAFKEKRAPDFTGR